MLAVYADLGNTRLKWGRALPDGRLDVIALPLDDPDAWAAAWSGWNPDGAASRWRVSTVNPPVADRFGRFLFDVTGVRASWFRSAADVPLRHAIENPSSAGTDRALAVVGALAGRRGGVPGPGAVVSCGSAITVERVEADGTWAGGAIAPGFRLAAEALHRLSTQLPLVRPDRPPPPWGRSTVPAIEAGVFWGTVGAIRALVLGQSAGWPVSPWVVWTGGDADLLRGPTALGLPDERVAPALVLDGLRALEGP